jgi:hypothetical protein
LNLLGGFRCCDGASDHGVPPSGGVVERNLGRVVPAILPSLTLKLREKLALLGERYKGFA